MTASTCTCTLFLCTYTYNDRDGVVEYDSIILCLFVCVTLLIDFMMLMVIAYLVYLVYF